MKRQSLERALERAESEYREVSQRIRALWEKSDAERKLAKTRRKEYAHLFKSSIRIHIEAADLCRALLPLEAEIKRLKVALDPGKQAGAEACIIDPR